MIADLAALHIDAPADTVFAYISDPAKLDRWSLGTWQTILHPDGLIEGQGLATGSIALMRIDADPTRLIVDYHLGATDSDLRPRIFARVVPGTVTGHAHNSAALLLTALRTTDMDDTRWGQLCRAHAAELDIIKGQIETGFDPKA